MASKLQELKGFQYSVPVYINCTITSFARDIKWGCRDDRHHDCVKQTQLVNIQYNKYNANTPNTNKYNKYITMNNSL